MEYIDSWLNRITMYRLALYFLTVLFIVALVLSFFGQVYFKPLHLFISAVVLIATCYYSNKLFGKLFSATVNVDSAYITAFILVLIITPGQTIYDYWLLALAGVLAM